MTYLLYIDRHTYEIPPGDIADIRNRILSAVHAGGAFVAVPQVSRRPAQVLITSSSAVRIRETPNACARSRHDSGAACDIAFLERGI